MKVIVSYTSKTLVLIIQAPTLGFWEGLASHLVYSSGLQTRRWGVQGIWGEWSRFQGGERVGVRIRLSWCERHA